jgi:hypothetical protein
LASTLADAFPSLFLMGLWFRFRVILPCNPMFHSCMKGLKSMTLGGITGGGLYHVLLVIGKKGRGSIMT